MFCIPHGATSPLPLSSAHYCWVLLSGQGSVPTLLGMPCGRGCRAPCAGFEAHEPIALLAMARF